MKRYLMFILIVLFFTPSAFSFDPIFEYSESDNELISNYKLFSYRISNNSFIDGMYLTKATVSIERENMLVNMQAWIEDISNEESVANFLAYNYCDLVFKAVMEGMAASINANDTRFDSISDNVDYVDRYSLTDTFSMQNVFWENSKAGMNDLTISISCQGNI